MAADANDLWSESLRKNLPPGETLWREPIEADVRLDDGTWVHGALGVGVRNVHFYGENGFARIPIAEPITPPISVAEQGLYEHFRFGRAGREYRAATTDFAATREAVDEALELTLVPIESGRWAMRSHSYYPGSTQRAGYIYTQQEGNEIHYFIESFVPLPNDEEVGLPSGPWETPEIAFQRFKSWRSRVLGTP